MHFVSIASEPVQAFNPKPTVAFIVMTTFFAGTGSVYELEQSKKWRDFIQPRVQFLLDDKGVFENETDRVDIRSASGHIENIRGVLNLGVSELAGFFDVSRQSIYKWRAESSTPEEDKLNKIIKLSRVADRFREEGVSRAGDLLKMKAFSGKSLLELIKLDEDRSEHVMALIREAESMKSAYERSGLATSSSTPSDNWLSSVSIPGSLERA